jgi:hypothetical protein
MLQWGEVSIIQRLVQAPAAYFSDPQRLAVAAPTLVAACFRATRACDQAQQFLGLGLLADFLRGAQAQRAARAAAQASATHAAAAAAGGAARPGFAAAAARVPVRFAFEGRFPAALLDEAAEYFAARAVEGPPASCSRGRGSACVGADAGGVAPAADSVR